MNMGIRDFGLLVTHHVFSFLLCSDFFCGGKGEMCRAPIAPCVGLQLMGALANGPNCPLDRMPLCPTH